MFEQCWDFGKGIRLTKKRQEEKNEQIKNLILETAKDIISNEGLEKLSIRKIVKQIDYSPAIVYHYFKNKDEIINTLVAQGYRRILSSVMSVDKNSEQPHLQIKQTMTNYIKAALTYPQEYKALMLKDNDDVLKITGILSEGISAKSKTLGLLCEIIQGGIDIGIFKDGNVELMAQVLWTSMFGLTTKLIVEKNIPEAQVDNLIEQLFDTLFHGMIKMEA